MTRMGMGDLEVAAALFTARGALREALKVSEEQGYSQLADRLLELIRDFGEMPQLWIDELTELQDG